MIYSKRLSKILIADTETYDFLKSQCEVFNLDLNFVIDNNSFLQIKKMCQMNTERSCTILWMKNLICFNII